MTYRAMFLNILMSVACCAHSPIMIAGQQKMGVQQMQDFEKELEEANKAIEEFVSSLPPAEQAEFNRQVEEMSRMFENMNEDEFEKFLGEMFAEEPTMEPNPFTETQQIVQEVVGVTLSAEDKKKVETALKILDDIIKQSNLFMVLINSSAELPNRITRWGTKGDISNWQAGAQWNTFKLELEALVHKLYKAEEQDLDTKKYKYLLELIADEALYNNLIELQTSLNALVPTINLPEFGIQKLSAQSKTVIKDILKKYTESFYLLTIPKSLDTLFEKYAPEAEKIRAAEEAANKRALESARGVRYPAAPSEPAGVEAGSMGYDYGYGYPQYYGGDYGYNPYDSYGQYGSSPDYGSSGFDTGAGAGKPSGGGGAGGGGGSTGGGDKGKEEEGDKDKGKKEQQRFVPEHEIERAIADIKTGLDDIKGAMVDEEGNPTKLAKLADTINESDVDIILAGSTLPKIVDTKLDAINNALETIDKKKLTPNDLSHYQREVQKAFDKNKKELEQLQKEVSTFSTADKIKEEEDQAKRHPAKEGEKPKAKTDIATLSKEKQWAYFGGELAELPVDDTTNKLTTDIGTPISLFEIKTKIDKLFDDMKKFMTKKSEVPVAPKKKEEAPAPETPTIE